MSKTERLALKEQQESEMIRKLVQEEKLKLKQGKLCFMCVQGIYRQRRPYFKLRLQDD